MDAARHVQRWHENDHAAAPGSSFRDAEAKRNGAELGMQKIAPRTLVSGARRDRAARNDDIGGACNLSREIAGSGRNEAEGAVVPQGGGVDGAPLYRLMNFMSPAYPVGAFSYSGGIEWAVEAGDIGDARTLRDWIGTMAAAGSIFCDAVLFVQAHDATASGDAGRIAEIAELAAAMAGCKERFLETTAQGAAFIQVTSAAWPCPALDRLAAAWSGPVAYPVAVASACAGHGIAAAAAMHAFLFAVAANLVSAGIRLIPLGQTDGQRVLAALESALLGTAERALGATIDDIGAATLRADIAGMRHETQYTRLFRS
jgi:urease accessory protein